jgi:hypothetical protein
LAPPLGELSAKQTERANAEKQTEAEKEYFCFPSGIVEKPYFFAGVCRKIIDFMVRT